jgi:glutamyl-tRNA synthetase
MDVRTRYAPSPTGIPHVGNLRTALFSWLLARHFGGRFIVRLEDTDRARFVPEAAAAIADSLSWLGLEWDEGLGRGGAYGPYTQSERLPEYQAAVARLIEQGDGYECWCSPERLEFVRAEQARNRQPPRYDRRCREAAGRAEARAEAGADARPVVRFKTPLEGSVTLDDAVHGLLTFDLATIDDFVILKSDGFPVYHLAYMVDDRAMRISHVLRGDEWLPSVPRHMLLYRALEIDPPVIAHLPRILGPDGQKLSKRFGATPVSEYRAQGYLPDAMVNFLALIGWSLDDKADIISREQLVEHFTLERVVKAPGIFNIDKLMWMNGVYIREMPERELTETFARWLEDGLPAEAARPVDRALVARIAPLVRERVKLLSEVVAYTDFFFIDALDYSAAELLGKAFAMKPLEAKSLIERSVAAIEAIASWTHEPIEAALRSLAADAGVKAGDLFSLVRVGVTGRRVTPPLFESMEVLGRERCLARLRAAARML